MANEPVLPSVKVDSRRYLVVNGARVAQLTKARNELVLMNMFRRSGSNEPRFVTISLAAIQRVLDKRE